MTLTLRPPSKVRSPYGVAAALTVGVVADVGFDPIHRHVPMCPFKATTGWDCPLCGGLRATDHLAHGNVAAAFHDNAPLLLALPLIVWAWSDAVLDRRAGKPYRRVPTRLAWSGAALLAVFAVVRNLPGMAALRPA